MLTDVGICLCAGLYELGMNGFRQSTRFVFWYLSRSAVRRTAVWVTGQRTSKKGGCLDLIHTFVGGRSWNQR